MSKYAGVLLLFFCWVGSLCPTAQADDPKARLIDVRRIWWGGNHNAFTDLIWYKDAWFCTCREGKSHVSPDGVIRIITSRDAVAWTPVALFKNPIADLRDGKLSINPKGQLCLTAAAAWHDKSKVSHTTFLWTSEDGKTWSEPTQIGEENHWLWRTTWHDGIGYNVGYALRDKPNTRLYRSLDGKTFDVFVPTLRDEGMVNESTLLFCQDGTALCVIRRDGKPDNAFLGTAKAPYDRWTFKEMDRFVGGPDLLQLPDGRIVLAGRKLIEAENPHQRQRTQLWWLNPETAELTEMFMLPSGGDTSYPGLAFRNETLYVSYYSTHEKHTSVYLAQIRFVK